MAEMLLQLKDLSVNYGGVKALKEITLGVPEGKVICLIGSNGAGKTTCVKSVLGLVDGRGGQIRFDDNDITSLPPEKRVQIGIGCSPEGRKIFTDQTVLDNLFLGAYVRRQYHGEVKKDINRMFDRFPMLKEKAHQIAGTLSGGQQQILSIMRALMSRPRLLLLDEPSLGLAPIIIKEIYELVREANAQGMTILLIEQYASYALSVSHAGYVLEQGAIVAQGISDELKQNPKVVEGYLGETNLEAAAADLQD